jgi:hypothetical protein
MSAVQICYPPFIGRKILISGRTLYSKRAFGERTGESRFVLDLVFILGCSSAGQQSCLMDLTIKIPLKGIGVWTIILISRGCQYANFLVGYQWLVPFQAEYQNIPFGKIHAHIAFIVAPFTVSIGAVSVRPGAVHLLPYNGLVAFSPAKVFNGMLATVSVWGWPIHFIPLWVVYLFYCLYIVYRRFHGFL